MLKILFVCTGNTCRSPMAEALFKNELANHHLPFDVGIFSAGLSANKGDKVNHTARQLLESEGIDLSNHYAVNINQKMIHEADLIFVMTHDHLSRILANFPAAEGKTYLLKEFADRRWVGSEIEDPLGLGLEKYRVVLEEIRTSIKKIIYKFVEGRQV